ncbi:MAG: hypothetical protein ACI8ZN_001520 [Bacteroidia bacterium]|jgi:hypothetical protein
MQIIHHYEYGHWLIQNLVQLKTINQTTYNFLLDTVSWIIPVQSNSDKVSLQWSWHLFYFGL